MSQDWTVEEVDGDRSKACDSRSEAESVKEDMEGLGMDVEIVAPNEQPATDGGEPTTVEATAVEPATEPDDAAPELREREHELAERTVSEDPIQWLPAEFVDDIDSTKAINRKGFEVLAHFYQVDVETDLVVPPEETDFEHCRAKAVATTPDGRTCEAFGTAHTERGDDMELLVEMACTRARKRALSIATGAGAVAVAELRNQMEGER